MEKIAFKMKLKPGKIAEYKKRHQEIWPALKMLLKLNGVSDYSIFFDEETNILFAVQYSTADGSSSQDLGNNELVKRWWAYMADLMDTHADHSPVTVRLTQVFHMD